MKQKEERLSQEEMERTLRLSKMPGSRAITHIFEDGSRLVTRPTAACVNIEKITEYARTMGTIKSIKIH